MKQPGSILYQTKLKVWFYLKHIKLKIDLIRRSWTGWPDWTDRFRGWTHRFSQVSQNRSTVWIKLGPTGYCRWGIVSTAQNTFKPPFPHLFPLLPSIALKWLVLVTCWLKVWFNYHSYSTIVLSRYSGYALYIL